MKKISFILFALCISSATFAQTTYMADKAHAKVGFTITHLGLSEVDGTFKTIDAKVTAAKEDFSDAVFEFSADISSISTGNEMRDGHLQGDNWFNAAQFPKLTFKSTGISKVADKKYKLTGNLTIKGVTKSVTLDCTLLGTTVDKKSSKKVAGFKVSGYIKRPDFGVGGAGSMPVSEDVELRASGEFKEG
jgi:polyisoprenoid-binding protein YceI